MGEQCGKSLNNEFKEERENKKQCSKFKEYLNNVSYEQFVRFMYQPKDPSSLGVIRFLFGLLMLIDLPEERGGSDIDFRWGDPRDCHFPLFPILRPLPYPYMALLYGIMWFGACGIMLGYKFQTSALLFGVPYWYLLLLDKSFWNNHSYLFGIVTILLVGSSANHYLSLDGLFDERKKNRHVPYWNYFILKFQFFMLYFLAGLKKTDKEWLEGYSMTNLGNHWVFLPFTLFLTVEQIDYLVVHWFGFLLDLTIGFWMLIEITRPIAMIFCACFHLMNSRLFSIGMFPYVCLATMPLFCTETWPRRLQSIFFKKVNYRVEPSPVCVYTRQQSEDYHDLQLPHEINWKHKLVVGLLLTHCGLQCFLPYSHFITQGYNNWTKGLYGYSWDMMVHSWDTTIVVVKVVDNNSGGEFFLDPAAWTQNERWNKHADMCLQYAECLKNNLLQDLQHEKSREGVENEVGPKHITSENISIYVDVWCSLNGRFQQRMYDPNYDLLKANWSPFRPVEWLKPVLAEYNDFRGQMNQISQEVYSWSNYSDVLFIADFPGLYLENYITKDLRNVTLTVLEGEVFFEIEDEETSQSYGVKLGKNESVPVEVEVFHKVHTISSTPSCYMYVYMNKTREYLGELPQSSDSDRDVMYSPFPLIEDVQFRIDAFLRMVGHISNSFLHVFYNQPLIRRSRLPFS
ncbi:vitamin K-dependent gamma-carboxylase isoform X3 [Tribolium castaneum]|uniref:Vitamin K-dependent gamma-carboxylase-like Protein n=3 Tax=Tribolium castaneum TaxID=7070 RepID=D6WN88_TRICA|nr:PREDICTED: vitamin K-dependent gamma-carboxylase isoform X3 [Tribolium castaneum]EFA03079.2 Vitamin K-dependent gamma-carboxylase-like Protein [Tribolium castaneum]|eukprot:XP_015835577.1 PREDICTED: vitamin K-dependent gamma-carboxylase isoform X3 [Tribolium castaneum]